MAMFTEGLDPSALRWVQQDARSNPNCRRRFESVRGFQSDGKGGGGTGPRGFGLPPPEKFRSGHLPQAYVPVSSTIPGEEDSVSGASDTEEPTDSEEEIYSGRYSLDSSPQDDGMQPERHQRQWRQRGPGEATRVADGFRSPVISRQRQYSSETYSDLSSSRHHQHLNKQTRQAHASEYTEEESESGGSLEFTSGFQRCTGGAGMPSQRRYHQGSNVRSIPLQRGVETDSEKDPQVGCISSRNTNDAEAPSAPPLFVSASEIKEETVQAQAFRPKCTPSSKDSLGLSSSIKSQLNSNANEGVQSSDKTNAVDVETATSSGSIPVRVPNYHASGQGPWHSVIAYDACVRLCLHSWAKGCMEAPAFLDNECALLRNAFGLQQILLQSEEELLATRSSKHVSEVPAAKLKKMIGKIKVQIRRVRMGLDKPSGCSFSSFQPPMMKLKSIRHHMSNLQSTVSSGWVSLRKVRLLPHVPANSSFSRNSLAYMHASTQYIKQVSSLLKIGVTTLRNRSSYEIVQESYSCQLRLKSASEQDAIRMQPGSGESHVFFPDSLVDDLIIEVHDSKGKCYGRVHAQVAAIAESVSDKLRWWPIYCEPEHELVGHLQLYVNYTTGPDENGSIKCGSVAETVAYDLVLEVAMKVQHFQQRNLLLHGSWKWLLMEFASYYGVSDAYTKLRYLSYVMDVATPTADCLTLVFNLLSPVILRSQSKSTLSHQENRILGEIREQVEQSLTMVFENYKSLDESSPSGMMVVFQPATGSPSPALEPAVKLFTLLHDILSPEAQLKLCGYFEAAVKKRSRRHLAETDEFIANNLEGCMVNNMSLSTAYQKMKALCSSIRNEVYTDIEIHDHHVLPSFIDLPNISASMYSVELCNRVRAFLVACPPPGPSSPVADLVIATSDFQRDLANWKISPVKGGVDAKELFHLYIVLWIQDKRLQLLESCKLDKVKWSGVRTQHSTTPFVDEMYDRLRDTLNEYEVIISRWPEYTFVLESAVADIEKVVIETLEKQYADVLSPLKDSMNPKKFGLKYVQKLAKRSSMIPYTVPEELGILLNTMKRLLDVLRPRIETQLKSWGSCMPDGGNVVPGEHLSEVTVLLRAKFRNYLQAVVEKLAENSRLQSSTKLKKIILDSKDSLTESDIRSRMQPLKDQLIMTINHLHTLMEAHVFIAICRGLWDRMGQDVLSFLENRKENRSWYKGSRVTVATLDDTFASQMQQLLGNSLQDKDLEPPRSILEVRSVLCRDAANQKESNFYY
uniref:Calcium-dependent secretion activator n=1 Tax=Anthurium amnicola TaxID=1678845 RepID=A0A1D1Z558_9ARAE